MIFRRSIVALLIIPVCVLSSFGQEVPEFSVSHYNSDNGLPQNSVMKLEVDKNGFLWLTTQAGVVRFDGSHFETFDQHNTRLIMSNRIIDLGLTTDSTVYFKDSNFRVISFDKNNQAFLLNKKVRNQAVIVQAPATTYSVIDSLDAPSRKYIKSFLNDRFAVTVEYCQVGEAGEGFLRISDQHVFFVKGKKLVMYKDLGAEGLGAASIANSGVLGNKLLFFDREGSVSALSRYGTMQQMQLLNAADGKEIRVTPGHSFYQQGKQLFLGIGGSIFRVEEAPGPTLRCTFMLDTRGIRDIVSYRYLPALGIHAAGSATGGLYIFRKKQFRTVSIPGASANFYSQLVYRQNGVITEQGVVLPSGDYKTGYPFPLSSRSAIYQDRKGNIWVSDQASNLLMLDQDLQVRKTYFTGRPLSDVDEDAQGNIWISTFAGQFGKISGDTVAWMKLGPQGRNVAIAVPVSGNEFWMSDKKSTFTFNTITGEITGGASVKSTDIRDLYIDRQKTRWIGTYGNGFYAVRNGKVRQLPVDRNNHLLYTHSFREDRRGFLWMSTNHGLFKARIRDLYDYLDGRAASVYYYYYDKRNGFNTNEFNGGASPSSVVFPDGKFSFPSMDGLVQFYPEKITDILPGSKILIDYFFADGKRQPFTSDISLAPDVNRIEIRIVSPYFGSRENQVLEYHLKGLDKKWYPLPASGIITLNRLAGRDYVLQVRKKAGFGKDNVTLLEKHFVVRPFWYQTWYFRVFAVIVILAAVFGMVRLRYFYLIHRKKQLEKLVRERTIQLEYNNKLKEKITMLLAHDLQSPLHFLNVLSDYVSASVDKNQLQDVKTGIEEIRKAAGNIHAFVREINLWTKTQHDHFQLTRKAFAFDELMEELRLFFKEMLIFRNNVLEVTQEQDFRILTNRDILKAILRNLIDNANKYTSGGKIVVSLTAGEDGLLQLTVEDNGSGMSPADLNKLNRRIQQISATEGIESSGRLGYQIIIDFVARLGCRLEVQSEKGQGTIVTVSGLNVHKEEQPKPAPTSMQSYQ